MTFESFDLDPYPMTLILKLDLDMVKMYLHTIKEINNPSSNFCCYMCKIKF